MPGADPRIAVIVAAHNSQDFIEMTLASLVEQQLDDWACVVVDDGSTDETATRVKAIASRDGRFSVSTVGHAGVSAARNAGLFALDPAIPYVMFLDSDDLLLPDALGTLLDQLERRPDAVGAYGLAEYIDLSGRPLDGPKHSHVQRSRRVFDRTFRTRVLEQGEDTTFESLAIYGNIWPPGTALVRAPLARSTGGFLEGLGLLEDWDFFLRLATAGPFVHLDRQVAWYRRRAGAPTDPADAAYYSAVAAVRHHVWLWPATTDDQRRMLRRSHRRQHASAVKQRLASLCRPATWRQGAGHAAQEIALSAYAARVAFTGRPRPARGLLWRALDRRTRHHDGGRA